LIICESVRILDHVRSRQKTKIGNKIRQIEMRTGWAPSHKYAGMVQEQRLVDQVNDRYLEVIRTEDDALVHHCDEPLSHHRGHGSAKSKKSPESGT
jgi:hypothetical protein